MVIDPAVEVLATDVLSPAEVLLPAVEVLTVASDEAEVADEVELSNIVLSAVEVFG